MDAAPGSDRLPAIAGLLRGVAGRVGTPAYVIDLPTLREAAATVRAAFPDPWIRQYSVKANDAPTVIAAVAAEGLGANVVSAGEWSLARRAGLGNDRISLEGVGKTDADLRAAVRAAAAGAPLRWLAIESTDELDALVAAAVHLAPPTAVDVLLRLNPAVSPETDARLAVGRGDTKFGLTETELLAAVDRVAEAPGLRLRGIHLHVGSQLGAIDAWRDGARRALAILALVRGTRPAFDTLDLGGGFPVGPLDTAVPGVEHFADVVPGLLDAIPAERRPRYLAVEPGRVVVARAGWLVARVLHARERDGRQVVIDAGMTELIRPALYGARHDVVALTSLGRTVRSWAGPVPWRDDRVAPTAVEGPICEATDSLGRHDLPPLRRGDIVAIRDAGAYADAQSSRYNGRPRPPLVVLEADGSVRVARRRGSVAGVGPG